MVAICSLSFLSFEIYHDVSIYKEDCKFLNMDVNMQECTFLYIPDFEDLSISVLVKCSGIYLTLIKYF